MDSDCKHEHIRWEAIQVDQERREVWQYGMCLNCNARVMRIWTPGKPCVPENWKFNPGQIPPIPVR